MITPKQISDSLNVPPSTIRRWAARFEDHLSTCNLKKGQKRVYTTSDLDVFRRIRDYSASGFSLDKISELLDVVEKPIDESKGLLVLADFVQAIESAHNTIAEMRTQLEDQSAKIDDQSARIEALEKWINSPWYKKIFGSRPEK
jgi:DNA-binding transcriptional MerR regulator